MSASIPSPEPGKVLKAERRRLRLSTRDVERLSHEVARKHKNREYDLSHNWLTDIENGKKFTPSVYKLYSLSLIYRRDWKDILAFFGIRVGDVGKEQGALVLPHTHLVVPSLEQGDQTIMAPLELRGAVHFEKTGLVSRMFETWVEIPIGMLPQIDLRHSVYGYIGSEDYTLYPHVRPGALVQIDSRQRKIEPGIWQSESERPIYFFELRDIYVCSWCELNGNQLILIPSQQSGEKTKRVRYPDDAEIVGQVIGLAQSIAKSRCSSPREGPPKRPVG